MICSNTLIVAVISECMWLGYPKVKCVCNVAFLVAGHARPRALLISQNKRILKFPVYATSPTTYGPPTPIVTGGGKLAYSCYNQ